MLFNNIKYLCDQKGISISDLEQELGFSNKSIYRWNEEPTDNLSVPSVAKVMKVAEYFNVTIDALMRTDLTH